MSPARRIPAASLGVGLILIPLAGCVLYMALGILHGPTSIGAEAYPARVPLQGPYTQAELKLAESQLLQFPATQSLADPPTTQQVHIFAEGQRQMERARKGIWQRHQDQRLEQALGRRPVAWAVISLVMTLLILWSLAAYRLWTGR